MNKKHWNTISCKNAITFQLLRELIDHSYDLVWQSLSKKIREEIEQDEKKLPFLTTFSE
jgi:predicted DNA-binding protein (MmcQ/YjbR family)